MNSFIKLNAADNVVIALKNLRAGEVITVNDTVLNLLNDVGFGHKIAISAIAPGHKVIKYGLPIGKATTYIAAGEHVHTHNLISDYNHIS